MQNEPILTAAEQVAQMLRQQIQEGGLSGDLPGCDQLAGEFDVGNKTVIAAVQQLEKEGWLIAQGAGRRRRVAQPGKDKITRKLRLGILPFDNSSRGDAGNIAIVHGLEKAGFVTEFALKSLKDLGMRADRVARFVAKHPRDGWITIAASREVNAWFAGQPFPALALYGRFRGLPMAAAGSLTIDILVQSVERLLELGHTRIVMLARSERRKPERAKPEQAFIDTLKAAGLDAGDYNLPEWEETPRGLALCLDQLLRFTPPTAIIFQEPEIYLAARNHLAERGVVAPRDISIITAGYDTMFDWYLNQPAQYRWSEKAVAHRVVRWARNIARGRKDLKQTGIPGEFIEGDTIGPAPSGKM